MAQSILVKSKEIRVKNPNMVVEDENRAEVVEFSILNAGTIEGVSDMAFYVQYRNKLDEVGMDVLVNAYPSETIHNDMLVLDWLPSATFSKERGKVEIQIVGFTRTLEPTEDTTYKSGKLYFDENGEFIPVYPATSTHSPKVGDAITGTVYENEITADDHRWSSEKAILTLPENIYDNGTPIYTEEQVKNFITELNEQITIAKGYAEDAEDSATASATSASEAEDSADSAETNALKSEGFAVGEQNGTAVGSDSPYNKNNSKYYAGKSLQYAASAGVSSQLAGQYAEEADNARINSVSETQSQDDGGTNVVVITYKDGNTFTFFVKNGHTGTPFTIYKTYSSIAEMNADFANVPEGRFVIISSSVSDPDNSNMFVRGAESFTFVTDLSGAQGIQGPDGIAATITVGSVTSGATASVTNVGTSSAAVFDFVLPKGDQGDQGEQGEQGIPGPTPVITIGSVTYGDTPTVTIDTTDPAHPVMNFVLKTSEVGVVDNLTSNSQVDALSAKQGKVLKGLIDSANSRLNQHESRIENLEQKAGDYGTWHYPNDPDHSSDMPNKVPTGKAKYGLVKSFVGKSRAWNQLCQNPMFTDDTTGWTSTRGTIAYDSGRCKYTIATIGGSDNLSHRIYRNITFIANHVYLIAFDIQSPRAGNACCDAYSAGIGFDFAFPFSANVKTQAQRIVTATTTATASFDIGFGGYDSQYGYQVGDIIYFDNVILRDLTQYFGGNVPAGLDIGMVRQNYPSLLFPSAYDAGSLVSTEVSGVKSVGVNRWDEEWLKGGYYNDGEFSPNSNFICSKNMIPVIPDTAYYLVSPADNRAVQFYAKDGTWLGGQNGASFTTPSNCYFIHFYTWTYTADYNHDIQISEVHGSVSTVNTTYHSYKTDTLSLSETVTLRSAGSVSEVLTLETGKKTRPIGSVDLGTLTWIFGGGSSSKLQYASISPAPVNGFDFGTDSPNNNSVCSKLVYYNAGGANSLPSGKFYTTEGGHIYTRDDSFTGTAEEFKASMSGVILYYELATPDTDEQVCDPIIDNTIYTEGGGTIDTIQEQSPVIDNCLDVGYLAL